MSLLSPIAAFIVMCLLCVALFFFSGMLRTKDVHEEQKRDTYLCGETEDSLPKPDSEPSLQPEYRRFFATAFLFTVMEIGALFLGTVPTGVGLWLPLGFLGVMAISVCAILVEVFERRA